MFFSHKSSLARIFVSVLQAADILLFHATHVPVGVDQVAHLNLTNSLREDFNRVFKDDYFAPGKCRHVVASVMWSV